MISKYAIVMSMMFAVMALTIHNFLSCEQLLQCTIGYKECYEFWFNTFLWEVRIFLFFVINFFIFNTRNKVKYSVIKI
jgi:hypothetical protein